MTGYGQVKAYDPLCKKGFWASGAQGIVVGGGGERPRPDHEELCIDAEQLWLSSKENGSWGNIRSIR